jgi:hypothetical protein
MHNGKSFKKVPLMNLFKKSYDPLAQDKDFYSGEEIGNSDEEYSDFVGEVDTGELHREEPENSWNAHTVEVSITTPPIVLESLSNQSNQSTQSTFTSSLVHTQSRN